MTRLISTATALTVAIVFAIAGCGKSGDKTDSKTDGEKKSKNAHPSHGPHDGDLVELGDEEYHAEVVHDHDTHTVTIYILDSTAKKQVPIDAKEVVVNVKHEGKPEQFKLSAVPDKGDPQGKSSRFQIKDAEFFHHLEEKGTEPKLSLRIAGKSFTGKIEHHDHGKSGHKTH